jgi:hypothetical protein
MMKILQLESEWCQELLKANNPYASTFCLDFGEDIPKYGGGFDVGGEAGLDHGEKLFTNDFFSVSDVRRKGSPPGSNVFDYPSPLHSLMSNLSVLADLGVNTERADWAQCSGRISADLGVGAVSLFSGCTQLTNSAKGNHFAACDVYLPELLDSGIDVLVYTGVEYFVRKARSCTRL